MLKKKLSLVLSIVVLSFLMMSAASPVNPNIKFNTDVKKNDNVKLNETPLSYKELKKAAEKVKGSKLTLKERIGLKIFGKKIKNISKKVEREGKDKKTQGKGRTTDLLNSKKMFTFAV